MPDELRVDAWKFPEDAPDDAQLCVCWFDESDTTAKVIRRADHQFVTMADVRIASLPPARPAEPTSEAVAWACINCDGELYQAGTQAQSEHLRNSLNAFPNQDRWLKRPYSAIPLYAHPLPSDAPSDEDEGLADPALTSEDAMWGVVNEVFCRVYGDDYDAKREEWRAWYKPDAWFWWGRGLGAFMANNPPSPASPPQAAPVDLSAVEAAGRIIARWMGRMGDYDADVADWRSTCDDAAAEVLALYRTALSGVPAKEAGETK